MSQECNRFLKKKVYDHQSSYQSRAIPIPRFPPLAGEEATTFMGRVLSAVLRVTDPRSTVFSPECSGWYQAGDGSEVCGLGTFSVMTRAIGVIGLGGLDRLLAFHIVHQLGLFLRFYRANVVREHAPFLEQLHDRLFPPWASPDVAPKLYATAKTTLEKVVGTEHPHASTTTSAQATGKRAGLMSLSVHLWSVVCAADEPCAAVDPAGGPGAAAEAADRQGAALRLPHGRQPIPSGPHCHHE